MADFIECLGEVHNENISLFTIIQVIPTGLDSTVRLFADDTIAYLVIKSNSDALTLQRDLDKLAQWEQLWKMAFHPDKCNVVESTPVGMSFM
jgi:hypothetical protein